MKARLNEFGNRGYRRERKEGSVLANELISPPWHKILPKQLRPAQ
jgi:hypothetical protein